MASGIKADPNTYDFSLHYNWNQWLIGTELLLANVPWNNDYRDIVYMDDPNGLDDYLENVSQNYTMTNARTQRFESNVKVPLPINAALKFNYLRVRNPVQPGSLDVQRTYYYFILDVRWASFEATELILQLDVWQTFGREVSFGPCFVEQGHVGIANTNAFNNYGRDYLTESEGMDIGSEYRTLHVQNINIMSDPAHGDQPWILICSAADLTIDPGDVTAPILHSAKGGVYFGLPSGPSFYYFKNIPAFEAFMAAYSSRPWVTQAILSITAIPPLTRYYADSELPSAITIQGSDFIIDNIFPAPASAPQNTKATYYAQSWRDSAFISDVLGSRYSNLKKFYTYPYMAIEITTFSGSPLILKPEMWQDPDATMREMVAFVPPGQRVAIMPYHYNLSGETQTLTQGATAFGQDDFSEFLDLATWLDNFPSFPLVNNMALGFLAANKNGLAFQFANASWDQQRALSGAQAGVDVANAGIMNTGRQSGIANNMNTQQLINTQQMMPWQMSAQAMGSIGAGAGLGGPGGAGAAGIASIGNEMSQGMAMQVQQQNLQAAVTANSDSAISNIKTSGSIRDTNADYARFAAKGDYGMAVRGINAKIQDAALNQPSVSGQFGGDAFNLANNIFGYSIRWKFLNSRLVNVIGEIWLRYGYRIHQYMTIPTNFKVMQKFTYWKLQETYISQGYFPETFKQTIRGIFEKGVTVWSDPAYIGTTDFADNNPITANYY